MSDTLVSIEAPSSARRFTRRIPPRLRPLWEAYQTAWKGVSDAMDEEDTARAARPVGAARGFTKAEKEAKRKLALANKAFAAADATFATAPTRSPDDALCRIEFALDQEPPSDISDALKSALRVLRKVHGA